MRRKIPIIILFILLVLGMVMIMSVYAIPPINAVEDLSVRTQDGQDAWDGDEHGWYAFTQDGLTPNMLVADSIGAYCTLDYAGQTVYYSRVMNETIVNPVLRIDSVNRGIAIFLDNELLYTNVAGSDHQIGNMTLPMYETDHLDPITVSLPDDYHGKTLTIAVASPLQSELQSGSPLRVFMPTISLGNGYAYESGLIAESFRLSVGMTLTVIAGIAFALIAIQKGLRGQWDGTLLLATMLLLLWAFAQFASPSFFYHIFGQTKVDIFTYSRYFAIAVFLVFWAMHAKRYPKPIWCLAGIHLLVTIACFCADLLSQTQIAFLHPLLPATTGFFSLLSVLIYGFCFGKSEGNLGKMFAAINAVGLIAYGLYLILTPTHNEIFWQYTLSITSGTFVYPLYRLLPLIMISTVVPTFALQIRKLITEHTEKKLLAQQVVLANEMYENMRTYNKEVLILRHDMTKHFEYLRERSTEKNITAYLDALIGQNRKIRPIMESGNKTVDIIVNGKLAQYKPSTIEIFRFHVCESLPLSETQICSLLMNMMDNALHAVANASVPYLKVDFFIKDGFSVFSLENTVGENVQKGLGLGLKIIKQITEQYGGVMSIVQKPTRFELTVAIPCGEDRAMKNTIASTL